MNTGFAGSDSAAQTLTPFDSTTPLPHLQRAPLGDRTLDNTTTMPKAAFVVVLLCTAAGGAAFAPAHGPRRRGAAVRLAAATKPATSVRQTLDAVKNGLQAALRTRTSRLAVQLPPASR